MSLTLGVGSWRPIDQVASRGTIDCMVSRIGCPQSLLAVTTAGLLAILAVPASVMPWPRSAAAGSPFVLCHGSSANDCVIDGDTIEFDGQRIRMVDYDAPEISEPKCASEAALGERAKMRLLDLLNSGSVEARPLGRRDVDRYGRKLRLVLVNGRSVGDVLIAEGLAWPWQGHRHAWCQ